MTTFFNNFKKPCMGLIFSPLSQFWEQKMFSRKSGCHAQQLRTNIVRTVETGLGRRTLVVAVISVHAYPFLAFSDLTCHLQDTGIGLFWLHCAA